eukprot:m51a1_g9179 hypothetical protein (821) ;mRNA; f:51383-54201
MHFGKQLKLLAYAPWKQHYIDFVRLKHVIKSVVASLKSRSSTPSPRSAAPEPEPAASLASLAKNSSAASNAKAETEGQSLLSGAEPVELVERSGSPGDVAQASKATEPEPRVQLTPEAEKTFLTELHAERARVEGAEDALLFTFFLEQVVWAENTLREVEERRAEGPKDSAVLKKTFFDLAFTLEEILDFSRINLIGFTKAHTDPPHFSVGRLLPVQLSTIVKKFVRHTDFQGRESLMDEIKQSPFVKLVPSAESMLSRVYSDYGQAIRDPQKKSDPTEELRQSVVAARSWKMNTILFQFDEHMQKATVKPRPKQKFKPLQCAVAVLSFLVLYFAPIFDDDNQAAQSCLAILVSATIMWVTECWHLFVTGLVIAILVTGTTTLKSASGVALTHKESAKVVFQSLFPNNVALVLAGFSIAQAFHKLGLDMAIAARVVGSRLFQTPAMFMLATELLCFFMSLWISNVAASVLALTVVMPVIRGLPEKSTYAKALLLAVAVSGNIGGMGTQIASPQSSVTAGLEDKYAVDFIRYIVIVFPLCPVLLILGHFIVYLQYKPDITALPKVEGQQQQQDAPLRAVADGTSAGSVAQMIGDVEARKVGPSSRQAKRRQWSTRLRMASVLLITGFSVAMWVASPWIERLGCSVGVISLIPLVLFYGFGLLSKEDFESLPWALTMLIAGGNVLGKAADSSGLLALGANVLDKIGDNAFFVSLTSCAIMMVASSFISHTVAALILLSLFARVGEAVQHAKLMVMTSVVVCCGTMPFPVSSFPNLNAVSVTNADGEPYVTTWDIVRVGVPVTLFSYFGANTVTYGMSLVFGF